MDILFLLLEIGTSSNMYTDLIDEFVGKGYHVTIITQSNTRNTYLLKKDGIQYLYVKSLKILNVKNMVKKGIGLALLPYYFKKAYKKYMKTKSFDWVFMPTPPITLVDFVKSVKKQTHAKFYLILRDIHPQSAASIGLIKYRFMYNYLEKRAKKGYKIANIIGCMSQGNIDYIKNRYPEIDIHKLKLLMNWQKAVDHQHFDGNIRNKYNLSGKYVVLFGGNIGLGQRIENIVALAKHYVDNPNIVFIVIGKGVEKDRLENITEENELHNIRFIDYMPRDEYLSLISSVDLGLISINENYKVPTCPSKAVSYMSMKIPILAMINPDNDYGIMIEKAGAGFWAVGSDKDLVFKHFDQIYNNTELRENMGNNGYKYYMENLTSIQAFLTIKKQIEYYG